MNLRPSCDVGNRHAAVASCITHSTLINVLRVKQSARKPFISLQLNYLRTNGGGFTAPSGFYLFLLQFLLVEAFTAGNWRWRQPIVELHCISGVAQGIKAREGGSASFQPITGAVVRRGHLPDYRLQTVSSLFQNLTRLIIESTYCILEVWKEIGDGVRAGGGVKQTIYIHNDLSASHSWMAWVLFLFGVARGRKNCSLQH